MKFGASHHQTNAGFGIVEIMIALLLGIIIMLGVSEIATNNSRTTGEAERAGQQIENAGYALDLLETDLLNAAFWGEAREQAAAGSPPPICLDDGANVVTDILEDGMGYPIQGGHTYNISPYDSISCPPAAFELEPKPGTDFIAIRRASSCALGDAGCAAAGSNFHLQVNACFQASNPEDTERVKISDTDADLDGHNRDCDTAISAPKYRFLNRIYFVNTQNQLVRVELESAEYTETVLVDDVEMLRFEYGLDTSGDGQEDLPADPDDPYPAEPDITNGADATDVARWSDVTRVKISLVTRAAKPSVGFTDEKIYTLADLVYDYSATPATKSEGATTYCVDLPPRDACTVTIPHADKGHRRQLFSRTVSLRNVAGRRE